MTYKQRHYILRGHEPVPCDLLTWAKWFATANRRVRANDVGPLFVSTVFVGLDHASSSEPPQIFETMILNDMMEDEHCTRCSTWTQAEDMHATALQIACKRILQLDEAMGEFGAVLSRLKKPS